MKIIKGTICTTEDLSENNWIHQGNLNGTQVWKKIIKRKEHLLYYDTKEKKVVSVGPKRY